MTVGRRSILVVGSRFARVYLRALQAEDHPFELAAILARGSDRSIACAQHYGVPLVRRVEDVPDDIDAACVVVGTGIVGGPGAELAQALMARRMHVLQEHPLHTDELAACLAAARRERVTYHLNTLYPHLPPVRRFLAAAEDLRTVHPPLFVEATGALLTSYSLLDLVCRVLGATRPWSFAEAFAGEPSALASPFRAVEGAVAGTPVRLLIQNQMDASNPDSGAHILHRITVGFGGGVLTLADTHGPVLWSPRPHMPRASESTVALEDAGAEHFRFPSTTVIGPATAPPYREILADMWPGGVRRALRQFHEAIASGESALTPGQYHLSLARLWQEATARLGSVHLLHGPEPEPLGADRLVAAAEVAGGPS